MPVEAQEFVRRMRGGAQAQLVRANDGNYYVVKFQHNPQHQRILANELIASVLLDYLQITAPAGSVISVSQELIDQSPDAGFEVGGKFQRFQGGLQFGSRYPGDPNRVAVYDFLPDRLLEDVVNRRHFLAMLVFDKWIANADGRQAVFFRAKVNEWAPRMEVKGKQVALLAAMIDHGFAFNGPHWEFVDAPLQGLYPRRAVYKDVRSWEDFEPWLSQVQGIPEEVFDKAYRQIPREWVAGEEEDLMRLLERLLERRERVPDLIEMSKERQADLFPNWS